MKFNPAELIAGIKSYIDRRLAPVSKRLNDLEMVQKAHKDVDISSLVEAEVEKRLASIPAPINGRDGRDALQIEILPAIDTEKSYPRGTYAKHGGGLWRAYQSTTGLHGWECIVDGVKSVEIEQTDTKAFTIKTLMSSGEEQAQVFTLPVTVYKGTYVESESYTKGDLVTWGGSVWHSEIEENTTKPGAGEEWKLAVKKGQNGRDLR
ncbi:hypothetical protein HOP61_13305 [Halomonas daqingensis]|uniref:Uncharacterized protein n=1 Tax=Billgrantia desiderata TaxID=52021 RepID=A0AAW4YUA2_9GAMM|nr:hypothetical protein [Halomonas desiderata]MCE8052282.1 hypothetical protein [Halomonas desiderata]